MTPRHALAGSATDGPPAAAAAPAPAGPAPDPAADPGFATLPGLADYAATLAAMEARIAAIRAGEAAEQVWLLEHPPLLTAGTSAREADLLAPGGLPVHHVGRGGQWTYHGPGQRIGYVMLDLGRPHGRVPARDVRAFVSGVEQVLIEALAEFGVEAGRRDGRIGLWVAAPDGRENKIAAIGLRVTRGVTWHGFALNVSPDLAAFGRIVPCGISAHGVTSLAALGIGGGAGVGIADDAIRRGFGRVFGFGAGGRPGG